ncbi:Spo0E family sporulation regulatory protein-aspartic acid phosphatase [Paenibacillus marinisediminis]
MFCSDYTLSPYSGQLLRDNRTQPMWSSKARNVSSRLVDLEHEIRVLRKQMELLVQEENSFTAKNVIEISSALDVKINEYMKSNV